MYRDRYLYTHVFMPLCEYIHTYGHMHICMCIYVYGYKERATIFMHIYQSEPMHIHVRRLGEQSGVMHSEVLQKHLSWTVSVNSFFHFVRSSYAWELLPKTRLGDASEPFWMVNWPGSNFERSRDAWEQFSSPRDLLWTLRVRLGAVQLFR